MFKIELNLPDIIEDANLRTTPAVLDIFLEYKKSGIYAFEDFFSREILYIGKATDLKRRFNQHIGESSYQYWRGIVASEARVHKALADRDLIVSLCFVDSQNIGLAETLNIRKYQPTLNKYLF